MLFILASLPPDVAGALASDKLDGALEPAPRRRSQPGDGFFFGAEILLAGFFPASGLAACGRAFPSWLGWISFVLAVVALIPPIGWAVVFWGLPIWILHRLRAHVARSGARSQRRSSRSVGRAVPTLAGWPGRREPK